MYFAQPSFCFFEWCGLELKWNFHILKLTILKWKNYPVTLDISKNQWRSTGGLDAKAEICFFWKIKDIIISF